jgi:transcriptional regulator GlxA family with amidase domain
MWTTVAAIAVLNLAVYMSHAAKVTDSVAAAPPQVKALKPPANGQINVAFLVSEDADVMDIAGPWEAFGDTMFNSQGKVWHPEDGDMIMPFHLYTVSDSLKPVNANGLTIVPDYTFQTAPSPQVIVIPAQGGRGEAQKAWLLANSKTADVTMSVCTGASILAKYGLLDGKTATTHHLYAQQIQKNYPAVHFVSGTRFVENGNIATAGGLTSGIDLALHIVERYYGREAAQATADYMEYHGDLWKSPQYDSVKQVVAAK